MYIKIMCTMLFFLLVSGKVLAEITYPVIDTNQTQTFDDRSEIPLFAQELRSTLPSIAENGSIRKLEIRYATMDGVDAKFHSFDVYAPKNAQKLPMLLFIHGGGWRRGDKAGTGSKSHAQFYTEHSWIYISINYRLSPAVMHPTHVEDVAHALVFIHKHAAEWGGDTTQMYVSGHSAGAHLISLVTLNERFLISVGESLAMLRGVVLLDTAAYDLEAIMQRNLDAASPYPTAFGKDPAVWHDASPLAHISAGKGLPPFLFVLASGSQDKVKHCEVMTEKLRGIGVRAEILDVSTLRHHGTLNSEFGATNDPVAPKVLAFLESVRKGQTKTLGTRETLAVPNAVTMKATLESNTARAHLFIKRSDKNGDRKWSPNEAPALFQHQFDMFDTNKDGFLDAHEVGAALRANTRNKFEASKKTSLATQPLSSIAFTNDYFPGTKDSTGRALVGTEMMNFAVHDGRLYAGLGNRNLPGNATVTEGAQVIVKDAAEAWWRVEHQFPSTASRINAMISATFTTVANGHSLAHPVTMLIAAPSHDAATSESKASWGTAWTRDDESGIWTETRIYSADRRKPACRAFITYRDPITNICHLFAGTSHGSIHRAAYDPSAPGRLSWTDRAELENTGRVVTFAECNTVLYAACGLRRTQRDGVRGGLYRRVNGPHPKWECVYRWPWPQRRGNADEALLMRGLTAVMAADGKGEVLLGSRAQAGVIERINPRSDHTVTIDLDIRDHFAKLWDLPHYRGAALSAYNQMMPWIDPRTEELVHLIGVAVLHPTLASTPPHNGAWYLIRSKTGEYTTAYVYDFAHPLAQGENLRGVRAIQASPFGDGNIYIGGGDIGKQTSLNTAWIYKGTGSHYSLTEQFDRQ